MTRSAIPLRRSRRIWVRARGGSGRPLGRCRVVDRRARTDHPEFAGKTVSFFNYLGSDGLYVISSDKDFSIKFLKQLGFDGVTDTIAKMSGGPQEGRVLVSPERYADREADLLMGTSSLGPAQLDKLAKHPTFAKLPAIGRGRTSRSTSDIPPPWSSPRR